jgi:hypothetical protein
MWPLVLSAMAGRRRGRSETVPRAHAHHWFSVLSGVLPVWSGRGSTRAFLKPGVLVHACNPSPWGLRQKD